MKECQHGDGEFGPFSVDLEPEFLESERETAKRGSREQAG